MLKIHWMPIALLLCLSFSARAQKYEREARIKPREMPAPALLYLADTYPDRRRTKHYAEHSRYGQEETLTLFYESKFKSDSYRYSVKFDSLGQLHDVERIIKFDQLPSPVKKVVQEDLGESFKHFRIKKIQERYAPAGQLVGYEMEISGKRGGAVGDYELQYSPDGQRQSLQSIESDPNPFFFF